MFVLQKLCGKETQYNAKKTNHPQSKDLNSTSLSFWYFVIFRGFVEHCIYPKMQLEAEKIIGDIIHYIDSSNGPL